MNDLVECKTQADVDRVTRAGDIAIVRSGQVTATGSAQVTAYGSAQVTAYGSAQVTAYGSAQVTATGSAQVTAYDSAQVRATGSAQVRAYDSAQVTAYDSAQVTATGSAQVTATGSAQVTATPYVAVTVHERYGRKPRVRGGVIIELPRLDTPEAWCEFYGVKVARGVATLYKAVDDDYSTANARADGIDYRPGSKPEAKSWRTDVECGDGLHFSPRPFMALQFNPDATRFVACPVKVADMAVHPDGSYPQKVKAPRVVGKGCVEVDIDGNPVKAVQS